MPIENDENMVSVGKEKANPSGINEVTDVTYNVNRVDITAEEGEQIVKIASTWEGTKYKPIGELSAKSISGDCSGTTFHIYKEAKFPYGAYKRTGDFKFYVESSESRFKKVNIDGAQPGDIILWEGHMAIYSGKNSMWTAFNSTGKPYGQSDYKYWGVILGVYRYQKDLPNDKN